MHWIYLVLAGCFECAFTTCLKLSDGMTKIGWSIAFVLMSIVSFALLTLAAQKVPLGTAYAVWTGIGAAGAATVGMLFLGDAVSTMKLVSIALILAGVTGLNLSGVTP